MTNLPNWFENDGQKNFTDVLLPRFAERDAFIPPKPFDSWVLDESTCLWEAPVEYPQDGEEYAWNEETISWDLVVSDS